MWPPRDATPVDTGGLYQDLAADGYQYGPAFRGLRAAWRHGSDILAEVILPDNADPGTFGLHPALLDAALHASALAGDPRQADRGHSDAGRAGDPRLAGVGPGEIVLPFAWTGVSLHAAGASALRVRLRREANGELSLTAADDTGAPVVSVRSLVSRPVPVARPETAAAGPRDALFGEEWVPVPARAPAPAGRCAVIGADVVGLRSGLAAEGADVGAHAGLAGLAGSLTAGAPVPDVVFAHAGAAACDDGAGPARELAGEVLGLVQAWLAEDRLSSSRLVLVTRGAMTAEPGEAVTDLAAATVWGLIRSVQSENPGRLVLADLPPPRLAPPRLAQPGPAWRCWWRRWVRTNRSWRSARVRRTPGGSPARPPVCWSRRTAASRGGWTSPSRGRWTTWPWCLTPRRPRRWRPARSGSRFARPG